LPLMKIVAQEYATEELAVPRLGLPHLRRQGIFRLVLPGVLLVLVCLIPFLNKAYTIDDPWFLLEARQILKTPLQPMSFQICWMGNETCLLRAGSLGAGTIQGLMGYLLVPVIALGGSEWIAHLLQILLACVAVIGMVRLTLHLGFDRVQAAIAGLMLAAIPPFLSMASTAMPDVAGLALGLTGIERFLAWKDQRRWHQAAIASLMLGLAPYARPHLALFIPLVAVLLFTEASSQATPPPVRRVAYLCSPVVIATCILVTMNLLTRDRGPLNEATDILVGRDNIPRNLYAYGRYLAFPIPFAAVWLVMHWRKALSVVVIPSILLVIILILSSRISLAQDWPYAAALYGLATVLHMICRYVRTRDRVGVLLGLWVLIPVPALIYVHFPIKYMLPVLPAIVLILIRTLSILPGQRALSTFAALILTCTGISCVLLKADADFAEYGRRASAELIAPHVAAGETVWYGGQWGFYWYAREAGARISKPGEPGPNPGDLLAVGLAEGGNVTRDRFPNRILIASRRYDSPHGRTMGSGACLYSNGCGDALWVWNPGATNVYELWRIY
jgi:hypothetical protein